MKKLLFALLLVFVLSQRKPPKPRPHFNLISKVNVTKAVGFKLKNNTEKYKDEISKLDIPAKIKEMALKADLNKNVSAYSDLKLDYDNKTGGRAKGEFYFLRKLNRKANATVEFFYGTANALLKPLPPQTELICHRNKKGKKICRNVTHKHTLNEKQIKKIVEKRMRHEIRLHVERRFPRPKKNKTKKN